MKKYSYSEVIRTFEQLNGYKNINVSIPDVCFLFKRFKDSYHGIVVIDNINTIVLSRTNVESIHGKILSEYHLPKDMPMTILTVVLDSFKVSKTRYLTENMCALDIVTGKVKYNSICKDLSIEKSLISVYSESSNVKCAWIESTSDKMEKEHFAIMTIILAISNIAMFLLFFSSQNSDYGISAGKIMIVGQSYRLFTYMFLHAGIIHLISNTIALILYGREYERNNGFLSMFAIYLFGGVYAGVISTAASVLTSNFDTITVGASGSIFAILGAYVVDSFSNNYSNKSRNKLLLFYSIYLLIAGFFRGNVDVACHVGGFIAGIIGQKVIITSKKIALNKKYINSTKNVLKTDMRLISKRFE